MAAKKKATAKRATKKAAGRKIGGKKNTGAKKATGKRSGGKQLAKKSGGKMSQIEAAVKVLRQARKPMNCKAMVEAMQKKGLWQSAGGKTPEATLYASILRDLKKGKDARFKKVDRGLFALADGC